jgi:hypothetical protein
MKINAFYKQNYQKLKKKIIDFLCYINKRFIQCFKFIYFYSNIKVRQSSHNYNRIISKFIYF